MTQQKDLIDTNPEIISSLILNSDLSRMSETQRVLYYKTLCEKLGLNPYTKPFQIISFQGKTVLYATKDATEQLRKVHGVSVTELTKEFHNEINLYIVTCKVQDKHGRTDAATGVVSIRGLQGDALCNSLMKAESKSKRRATLSICGLGVLDESETDTLGKVEVKPIEVRTIEQEAYPSFQQCFNHIDKIETISELDTYCKQAAKEHEPGGYFVQQLRKKYSERKGQLEFIVEMGGTPDQRGFDDEGDVPQ